jgi:subtilisin family serine protease
MMVRVLLLLLAAAVALSGVAAPRVDSPSGVFGQPAAAQSRDDREVIVVLEDGADPAAAAADMGVKVTHIYRHVFTGFSGIMPAQAVAEARAASTPANIFTDSPVAIESQQVATGVRRIGTPLTSDGDHLAIASPIDADIAILDTGVTPNADLTVAGGTRCINVKAKEQKKQKQKKKQRKHKKRGKSSKKHHRQKSRKHGKRGNRSWRDNNGHGTYTAGVAAAIDNDEGIVGVAPGARIWAVKVLNADGKGFLSDVICGLDWVVGHKQTIDVVNLSLSAEGRDSSCQGTPLHRAVCATVNAGIPVVVAAGNQATDASTRVPAAFDQVITVSAMADADGKPGGLVPFTCTGNRDDTFASFSNFGPDVDIAAPGDCILSYLGDTLEEASGTSVATPHVTGAVARFIASFQAEHDRRPTPDETRAWLLSDGSRPQNSPEGFSGDPDGFHEPMLWVADAFPGR